LNDIRRIKINGTPNRMGLIFLVLKAIWDYGINIITMESDPYICVKLEWNDSMSEDDFLSFMKQRVPEIESISYIDLMEYERIEVELSTLLNNIDDAIIKADPNGYITSFNDKGKRMLYYKKENITDLKGLFKEACPALNNNTKHCSIEFIRENNGKEKGYLAELNPVKNEHEKVTSYFVIIKEMAGIRNLINTIMRPSMVTFNDILGESQEIKKTIDLAKSVSKSDASVMIRGESGTGKELFAKSIHMESLRADGPFVAVNCASIPEALIESEFFGYEKGSFTGANSSGKQGYFELATGGTLFLDEIGELAMHLQAKILRALQEHQIRRIGGTHEIDIDVRVISATHRNLEEMIKMKTFREDLYYRLNIIPIYIPPLRNRVGDIELMTKYFVNDLCMKNNKPTMNVTNDAMQRLVTFSWPGNVRELNNVLERAVFIANDVIDSNDIILDYRQFLNETDNSNELDIGDENFPVDLPELLSSIEKEYIDRAMSKFKSSRRAASNLNISHTTVINKLKHYKIPNEIGSYRD